MTRPTFDPTVYETAELAELNRPLHAIAWDMIEAERAARALNTATPRPGKVLIDAAYDTMFAARAAHAAALTVLDEQVADYVARQDAVVAPAFTDEQLALI